jgi:hypothetical protein
MVYLFSERYTHCTTEIVTHIAEVKARISDKIFLEAVYNPVLPANCISMAWNTQDECRITQYLATSVVDQG